MLPFAARIPAHPLRPKLWSMMGTLVCFFLLLNCAACQENTQDRTEVFSGPQVGEELSPFEVQSLVTNDSERLSIAPLDDQASQVIVFIHEITRPSIGLARQLSEAISRLPEPKPTVSIVFLTDDPTATRQWANNAQRALPTGTRLMLSVDGAEGPGALGLNRTVAMTLLICKGSEITGNFALVQPSVQADAPKILETLCNSIGANWEELSEQLLPATNPAAGVARMDDDSFRAIVRPLLNMQASAEEIAAIEKRFEQLASENAAFESRLIEAAKRIVESGRLENYGNEHAQAVLTRWSEKTPATRPNR